MNLIVNVSKNWAIGKGNSLLFHISQDMKFFKEHTTAKTVVMGRKTLESLPGSKPLPNRHNIVLTRNTDYKPQGVTLYNSIDEFVKENKNNDDVPWRISEKKFLSKLDEFIDEKYDKIV